MICHTIRDGWQGVLFIFVFTFSGKLSILEIIALNWPGNQSSGEHPGHPLLFYKTMGKNGWIKIHRKLQDSPIMSKPEYLTVWIHLLLLANHEKTEFIFNNQKMVLESGQLITSRQKLAAVCGIQESKIDRILKYLKSEQQIEQQTNNKFRLITIKNWNLYQQSEQQNEQPVNNQRTTSEQPVNTPKELISIKNNDKKDIPPRFTDTNLNHTFKQFLEMRKLIKKPLTTHGEELIIKRLNKENVETAIGMLNQSIERSWAGIFPLKEGFNNVTTKRMLS